MEVLSITFFVGSAMLTAVLISWTVVSAHDVIDADFRVKNMAHWNFFRWTSKGIMKFWDSFVTVATWKPKSGIDKEIAEEEKEIAELERQKEKIDTLANLKRRKERLFEEVHEEGYTHCKWCCGENTLKTALTRDGISYHICTLCGFEQ